MTEAKSDRTLLMPILAGLLGAGLALLFAPRSGKETRDRMRMRAEDVKHQAEEGMTEVRESLDRSIREAQDLKRRLSTTLDKGKQARKERESREAPEQSPVLSTWEEEV